MTDPPRLMDSSDLPLQLRQALRSERRRPPPAGLRAVVWAGVTATVGLSSTAVAGSAAAASGAVAGAKTAAFAVLSLETLKWLAIGFGIGSSVIAGATALGPDRAASPSARPREDRGVVVSPPTASPRGASKSTVPAEPVAVAPDSTLPAPIAEPGEQPHGVSSASVRSLAGGAASPAGPPSQPPPSSLARVEAARVGEARRLLRAGDGQGALSALTALDGEVPNGLLLQERQALRVEALSAVGRPADAARAAAAFLERHPESPHAARVRTWLGGPR